MNIAVIVAAGSGSRLAEKLGMKKQYFPLIGGKEMFVSALEPFIEDPSFEHYILIIPREDQTKVNEILKRENIYNQTELAFGGQTREESVNNAISALEASHPEYDPLTTHVFIHDADRPFLTSALLGRLKEASLTHQAVIPGIRLIDSLYNQEANRYEDRKKFTSIQTPQVFSLGLIEEAFKKAQDSTVQFGDEGSIVKYSGEDLFFVEGDAGNIKVSDEESLIFAQMQARFHGE